MIEEAAQKAGLCSRDLYRMRQHSIHWRAFVEGGEGYEG